MQRPSLLVSPPPADDSREDKNPLDGVAEFSGNLNDERSLALESFRQNALHWLREDAVEDTSKALASGLFSTHRVDVLYGSVFFHSATGDFTFVPVGAAMHALRVHPSSPDGSDEGATDYAASFRFSDQGESSEQSDRANLGFAFLIETQHVPVVERSSLVLKRGEITSLVGSDNLFSSDVDSTARLIFYRLTEVSDVWKLQRDGVDLGLDDSFTQRDVNMGLIRFVTSDYETFSGADVVLRVDNGALLVADSTTLTLPGHFAGDLAS